MYHPALLNPHLELVHCCTLSLCWDWSTQRANALWLSCNGEVIMIIFHFWQKTVFIPHFHFQFSFAQIPLIKIVHFGKICNKYLWICIFRTLNPFVCYLGVFAQNVPFIKYFWFIQKNFLRLILTCAKTPNRFSAIQKYFFRNIWQIIFLNYLLDVFTSSLKVW